MKTRNDFVSNSSSSSFIVIVHDGDKCSMPNIYEKPLFLPTDAGHHTFGWEFKNYTSLLDKLNFAAIQLADLFCLEMNAKLSNSTIKCKYLSQFDKLYAMLKEVCLKEIGIDIELNADILRCSFGNRHHLDYNYYIDHQSSVVENSCMEMFASYVSLRDFLIYNKSMVVGGNDNS